MRAARTVLGGLGVLVASYGVWLLLSRQDLDQLLSVAIWLVAGLVLHDLLISGAVVLLGALGARLLPPAVRGPVAGGLLVLGSVTLMAVPVLGRFGARPDNPTLLDRDYVAGWLVVAALVALVTGVVTALRVRTARSSRT